MELTKISKERIKRIKSREFLKDLLEKASGEVEAYIEDRLEAFKVFNIQ